MIQKKLLTPGFFKLFKESAFVGFTEYASLGALFLANIFVNRFYGNDELGVFSLCYAVAQIAVVGTGSAFSAILRRDVSLIQKANNHQLWHINQLKGLLIIICLFLLSFVLFFNNAATARLIYCIGLVLLAKGFDVLSETYYTTYQSVGLYRQYAVLKLLNAFLFITGIAVCCVTKLPADFIYFSMPATAFLAYGLNVAVYKNYAGQLTSVFHHQQGAGYKKYLLKEAWPLMLNALFFQLSSRLNVIIIFWLTSKADVAVFTAAVMGVTIFTAASNALAIVLFPDLNKQFNASPSAFLAKTNRLIRLLLLLGLLVAGIYYITISLQIKIIGNLPASANQVFKICSLFIPFAFATAAIGYSFVIIKKQRLGLVISMIVMLINAGSFYFLTKCFYQQGMAWAYVVSGAFQLLLIYGMLHYLLMKKIKAAL